MKLGYVIAWAFFSFAACKKEAPATDRVVYGASYRVNIATDKAFYKPGDKIEFSIDKDLAGSPKVRYKLLNNVIQEVSLTGNTWSWTAPAADFTGYMVEVYDVVDKEEKFIAPLAWMYLLIPLVFQEMPSCQNTVLSVTNRSER